MARILLIDDEGRIRKPVRILLESRGHQVMEAVDGVDGQDKVDHEEFDLAIVDLVMPRQGGLETIIELRRKYPGLRVIAMSGKLPTESGPLQNLTTQFGVSSVLHKPFSKRALLEALDKAGFPSGG